MYSSALQRLGRGYTLLGNFFFKKSPAAIVPAELWR
jgi:hypothetical protein